MDLVPTCTSIDMLINMSPTKAGVTYLICYTNSLDMKLASMVEYKSPAGIKYCSYKRALTTCIIVQSCHHVRRRVIVPLDFL